MASGKKRTSCAKAPLNRNASNATVAREAYPMMLEGMWSKKLFLQLFKIEEKRSLHSRPRADFFFDDYISEASTSPIKFTSRYVRAETIYAGILFLPQHQFSRSL